MMIMKSIMMKLQKRNMVQTKCKFEFKIRHVTDSYRMNHKIQYENITLGKNQVQDDPHLCPKRTQLEIQLSKLPCAAL